MLQKGTGITEMYYGSQKSWCHRNALASPKCSERPNISITMMSQKGTGITATYYGQQEPWHHPNVLYIPNISITLASQKHTMITNSPAVTKMY